MRRWLIPSLLAFAIASGCGWKRDLAKGNAAAEREDWQTAVEHYQAAVEQNPDDKALQARLTDARESAVESLVEQARAAQQADQTDQALDLLHQAEAISPRQLEVAMLREEIIGALATDVRTALALDEGAIDAAYARWTPFAERFPVHPETARLRDEIRAALAVDVQGLVEAEDYAAAHQRLKSFEDRLPMETELATVRGAWADSLTQQAAAAAKRRQRATAWATQAIAAGLSDSGEHREQRDAYRATFERSHGVVLGPKLVASDRAAMARLESRLAALFQHSAVRWAPGAPRPAIGGRIGLTEPRWDQSAKQTVSVHEFPGPERDHENPAWLTAKAELSQARAALGEAVKDEERIVASRAAQQRSLDGMREGLAAVELSLEGVRAEFAAAEGEANKARAALDESVGANGSVTQLQQQREALQVEVDAAQSSLDTALAALEAAGADGGDVAGANQAVDVARRGVEDRRTALDAAPKPTNLMRELARHVGTRAGQLADKERLLEAARAEREDRQAPVQDQLDAVARIEARIVELDAALEGSREAQAESQRGVEPAEQRLAEVPETIFGPTIERVEIPVQAHLRSCTGEISLELHSGSGGGVSLTRKLSARAETRDEERAEAAEHGLSADPLAFPESDAELQARVEAELAKQLRVQLEAQIALMAGGYLEQAAAAKDPEHQLRALIQAWMIAPGPAGDDPYAQPDPQAEAPAPTAAEALQAALVERWGVGEPGWLTAQSTGE